LGKAVRNEQGLPRRGSRPRIEIFEADGLDHALDPGVRTSYTGRLATIIIRPHLNAHTAINRRAFVHEATHAVSDAQLKGDWVWRLDDEATAYIAEWLFVIHASSNKDHLISEPDPDDTIEPIAFEIARALAHKPRSSPDSGAMRRLGNAIFHDPTYSVTMALHPWIRNHGIAKADFPKSPALASGSDATACERRHSACTYPAAGSIFDRCRDERTHASR
jgi:hypothetical protein